MLKFTKQYQLWIWGDSGYHPTEFDTIVECLDADKYDSRWYITKRINFEVTEIQGE